MRHFIASIALLASCATASAGWDFGSTDTGEVHYIWNHSRSDSSVSIGCGSYDGGGDYEWHFITAMIDMQDIRDLRYGESVGVRSNIEGLSGKWVNEHGNLTKRIYDSSGFTSFETALKKILHQIAKLGGFVSLTLSFDDNTIMELDYRGEGFLGVSVKMGEMCGSVGISRSEGGGQFGDTPLHRAVRENDLATARRIITTSHKGVLCARNSLGQVPAQLADILGRTEIWSMLYAMDATKHRCGR